MSKMDSQLSRAEMLREWRSWAEKVAEAAEKLLPGAAVHVLGSVVRGDYTGGSDVDILIVSDMLPESQLKRAESKGLIEEAAGLPPYHPMEIHLAKHGEADSYIRRTKGHIIKLR